MVTFVCVCVNHLDVMGVQTKKTTYIMKKSYNNNPGAFTIPKLQAILSHCLVTISKALSHCLVYLCVWWKHPFTTYFLFITVIINALKRVLWESETGITPAFCAILMFSLIFLLSIHLADCTPIRWIQYQNKSLSVRCYKCKDKHLKLSFSSKLICKTLFLFHV